MTRPGSIDDLDLMLRHDGELSPDQRRALDDALDDDARAKLEVLGHVGDLVRGRLELAADDATPRLDAMWARIEHTVASDAAARVEDAADPAAAPRSRGPRATDEQGGGIRNAVQGWLERWRSNVLTGAVCAAAAALVIMAVQRPPGPALAPGAGGGATASGAANPPGQPVVTAVNNPPPPAVQEPLVAQPPVVESLEVAGGSGTVLSIPGEDGENPTTVIWVTADDIVEDPI